MTVFEMAKKYYPKLWNRGRILALKDANKLTDSEVEEILGKESEED